MSVNPLTEISSVRAFGGTLTRYSHTSVVLGDLTMKFAVFTPDSVGAEGKQITPTLFYLSGLTCTDENVSQKGCIAFKYASEFGIAMVMPDTSPRGHSEIPTENDSYDFGTGAGFYLNATKEPWSKHYNMYDYVASELPGVMAAAFPWYTSDKISITGHSMGGHGAMTIGLKNPEKYKSISAFCPIVNPCQTAWGQKAFGGYLNDAAAEGPAYDTCELIKSGKKHPKPILVDQGDADDFYTGETKQLQPEALVEVCKSAGQPLEYALRKGFDHSYWFVSSHLENHIRFHAKHLA
ncbi:unnamed protein product [Amoebophrya sp. A25]|nr:unnamed protein product [Amoebophrya sp. A25]|eukprot:GSA25T00024388001.1